MYIILGVCTLQINKYKTVTINIEISIHPNRTVTTPKI